MFATKDSATRPDPVHIPFDDRDHSKKQHMQDSHSFSPNTNAQANPSNNSAELDFSQYTNNIVHMKLNEVLHVELYDVTEKKGAGDLNISNVQGNDRNMMDVNNGCTYHVNDDAYLRNVNDETNERELVRSLPIGPNNSDLRNFGREENYQEDGRIKPGSVGKELIPDMMAENDGNLNRETIFSERQLNDNNESDLSGVGYVPQQGRPLVPVNGRRLDASNTQRLMAKDIPPTTNRNICNTDQQGRSSEHRAGRDTVGLLRDPELDLTSKGVVRSEGRTDSERLEVSASDSIRDLDDYLHDQYPDKENSSVNSPNIPAQNMQLFSSSS